MFPIHEQVWGHSKGRWINCVTSPEDNGKLALLFRSLGDSSGAVRRRLTTGRLVCSPMSSSLARPRLRRCPDTMVHPEPITIPNYPPGALVLMGVPQLPTHIQANSKGRPSNSAKGLCRSTGLDHECMYLAWQEYDTLSVGEAPSREGEEV